MEADPIEVCPTSTQESVLLHRELFFPDEQNNLKNYNNSYILVGNALKFVYQKRNEKYSCETLTIRDRERFFKKLKKLHISHNEICLTPDKEKKLILSNLEITSAHALLKVWKRQDVPISLARQGIYYSLSAIAFLNASPSGYTYYPIGTASLENAFNYTNPALGSVLGGSSAGVNSGFNVWAMNDYMEKVIKAFFFLSYEKSVIHAASRNRSFWLKFSLLHLEAFFANMALTYISLEEQNGAIDFWVINQAVTGFFIAFANLDPFVDSVIDLVYRLKTATAQTQFYQKHFGNNLSPPPDLSDAIQRYFSELHSHYKLNNFGIQNSFPLIDLDIPQQSSLSIVDILSYFGGIIISGATLMGRYGLIKTCIEAAEFFLYEKMGVPRGMRPIALYTFAALILAPSIGWGISSGNSVADLLLKKFSAWWNGNKESHADNSISMHLFPRATWGLMLSLMVPVVLSFSGNLDLTAVALKGVEMADSLWWYYIIVSMIAPVLSNANGVIPFAQDLMNRLAINEWFFSDDNRRYANNEDFFKEFEVLLKKGLTNNKAAFESLLYFSQGSLEKVSTNDSEYTSHPLVKSLAKILKKGDLASIYKSIKFTPIDRKRIMCTLGLETKEEFDNYVAKMIESFDAVALPNENMENFLNNAENNTTNGENSIIILPENQPLLGKHRNSWFNCCRGKEEDDSENVSQNHTINNTRRINPESRPSCTLF